MKSKREKGALTVEACIALTIFLMVFVTILYIMRIVFAYGIMQHALNQTAKEFSTYSYYYAVSGMADINGQIQSSTAAGVASFDENVSNIVNVYDSFNTLGGSVKEASENASNGDLSGTLSSLQSVSGNYENFKESAGAAGNTIKSIANDPVAAIKSVGSVFLSGGNESAKTFLCGEISLGGLVVFLITHRVRKRFAELTGELTSLSSSMEELMREVGLPTERSEDQAAEASEDELERLLRFYEERY